LFLKDALSIGVKNGFCGVVLYFMLS